MAERDLKKSTKALVFRLIKVVEALPNTKLGNTIGYQLIRCGTAVGANYQASCRARSVKEFVAKLGVVIEEKDETLFWLEIIMEAELLASLNYGRIIQNRW